ncbi:ferrous iron transport protein B [Tichowtungia aerotolerans]|uniref:Ferrous iron transport protein B n=1 Tax=Tichowtungia aerotolerans TaxID=2697043 RepID=A0A6P1M806_9BACT|nr:ferrous iron transport protein B [Tichowtungia aerotolerans]QHI68298.1 ferrous iron transport protein B [Tichowtungia aerotolerans]
MKNFTIALAGNPNCGKTTLFNALTSSRERVGNWPGVTVEHLEGGYAFEDADYRVVDLPGIYSFSAGSLDEVAARDYILKEKPDAIVNVIDARNVERSLYLTAQLLEMRVPLVVVVNMAGLAKKRHIEVQISHLQKHLDCPVLQVEAIRKDDVGGLQQVIKKTAAEKPISKTHVQYDAVVEKAIDELMPEVTEAAKRVDVSARWLAVKLLERDHVAEDLTIGVCDELRAVQIDRVEKHIGEDIEIVMADGRYGFVHGLALDVVKRTGEMRKRMSDAIDRIVLSRALGIPLFLTIMYAVFSITINLSGPIIDWIDGVFGAVLVDGLGGWLEGIGSPMWLSVLLADGLGGGIQTVATFIPPIFFMFLCLSLLEESGYMARAAFVMDRSLRAIGLPGKAFIPMLVGFGCNVPGIMAARTLDNQRDRTLTVLLNPFMSCGARLPVYALFAGIFFPEQGGAVIFSLYLTGILLAIGSGLLFRRTILKGEASTFVMELPPYHVPRLAAISYHTWERLKEFILRAGKIILVLVLILSFLWSIGTDGSFGNQESDKSVLSAASRVITPVFHPMGITDENWPATLGLVTGIFGKELVVGTLNTFYGADGADPEASMLAAFDGRAGAFAYLLFVLIYMPCVAAVAAIQRETGWNWMFFSVFYLTALAWMFAVLFYQTATAVAHPVSSVFWCGGILLAMFAFAGLLKLISKKRIN